MHHIDESAKFTAKDDKMVVVSQITQTEVEETVKYPILLPTKPRTTDLIIQERHDGLHNGINHVVANIRRRWWIPRNRQRIQTVIITCMRRKREEGALYRGPSVPPLPICRVREARLFAVFAEREGQFADVEKLQCTVHLCITRAVHLDITNDLPVEGFPRTLLRFFARRSYIQTLIGDNGRNFVRSAKKPPFAIKTAAV